MVTIFSVEGDRSTDEVIDWLSHFGESWARINAEDFSKGKVSHSLDTDFNNCTKPSSVWFRKWNRKADAGPKDSEISQRLNLKKEFEAYSNFLFNTYENSYWLNKPVDKLVDKLSQMRKAESLGIETPKSLFTSRKKDLVDFYFKHKPLITKTLIANVYRADKTATYMGYTRDIEHAEIKELPEFFYPTLFQEKIQKEFEIRSFFLSGKFFSMAIFSQSDEKTSTDFRRYNRSKPNRRVPFKLPKEISQKLRNLLLNLDINSGSIDLIRNREGEYVFLEVNPLGQFGMVSAPCNYLLEKKIAEHLSKNKIF